MFISFYVLNISKWTVSVRLLKHCKILKMHFVGFALSINSLLLFTVLPTFPLGTPSLSSRDC